MKETICTVAGLVGGFIATLQPTSYPMSAYHSPSNRILTRDSDMLVMLRLMVSIISAGLAGRIIRIRL